MIRSEDEEYEKFFFEEYPDVAIPLEIRERKGNIEIISFSKTFEIAKEFEEKFSKDIFSEEARKFIDAKLKPYMKEIGYEPGEGIDGYVINYEAKTVNPELILPSTEKITADMKKDIDFSEIDLELCDGEIAFATVVSNKIVSVCELNSMEEGTNVCEINVRTSEEYQGNGYGASNVTAMSDHMLKNGYVVTYNAQFSNVASQRTAEKCGFEKTGKTYYYICYKEERNGI